MKTRILLLCALLLASLGIFAAAPDSSKPADSAVEAARHNNLGVAYMNQQSFDKALKEFQQAAALDPKLRIAHLNQGVALLGLAKLDQAATLLQEATKQAPRDPHAWFNLGLLYKNSSNIKSAVDAFRHVVAIDADDANTWYFLGAVYSQNKQFPEAMDAFQHALKLDPHHASAEFGLARAYQQSGDATHAREHLVKFQHITQSKLGTAMGLAYGDQGKYSLAEESPAAIEKALPEIPVKFVDVTKESGLISQPSKSDNNDLSTFVGPGACFLDYDGDGKIDIFLADNGPQGGMVLYQNLGSGKFQDVTKKAGLDPTGHAIGCTAGDYDNDGATDLAVSLKHNVLLLHNRKDGTFEDVAPVAGVKFPNLAPNSPAFNAGLTFIDYDHDGDLDLYVSNYLEGPTFDPRIKITGNIAGSILGSYGSYGAMFRNNGDSTFTNVTEETGLDNIGLASVGTDYDNDRAIDLAVTSWSGAAIFENPREGKFRRRVPWSTQQALSAKGIAVLDFNHDGWMDVAFTHWESPAVTLWRNNQGKSFERVPIPETNWARAYGIAAVDYDNDGWVDLVAVGETKDGKGEVKLFRNLGPDGFKDVTADVGLDKIQLKDPRAIITGDFDNDGATDLLITQNHGPAVLLRNEGGNKNNWLKLDLKGLADNKSAIGTKVEVFSGMNRQKFEIYGSNGYLGQNSTLLNIGLGHAKEADVVRMLWPGGVVQDEIEIAANKLQSFTEMDRRGSSCPTLFVWDGHHYELVADMIGAGVVGHWVGPHERNIARPTEYVKVDRNSIQEKNGKFSFRLMEPMEEVVYLDQVKMLAVDHPADFDVYPNEYFASNPPYPDFKVVASRGSDAQPPVGAWDEHGHNLLPDLLAHRYVGDFKLEPFKGFTKPHSLILDLGKPYDGGPLWLLMHGEIEYFTATGMYAASQAGIEATAPYVEALDSKGNWMKVVNDIGFPAGGPRTMTADLTNKLPEGTHRIRITTNLQIYWDSILIDRTPQNQQVRLSEIPLQSANLDFHGYPRQTEAQPPGVVKYNYEQVSATGPYAHAAGAYTRYGNVLPLLTKFDDRLAVFGSGEEVALEFDPAKLPPLAAGWKRDYFFLANGYEKDMDFYAADGSTVAPLPFRGMGTYPYAGKSFPLDQTHMNDLLNYNTRDLSGNEPKGYAFDYKK
ncbi:MAG TPA: FG-GAP-like repeat-containing protein [Terriglobales bacterium]|jgi:tetratricopeptide (TPR) repeat protein